MQPSAAYPLNLDVTSPATVPRWRPLVNWLLVIPHEIWLYILGIGAEIVAIISWFVILFTGQQPERMAEFQVGYLRYTWRVAAYLYAWSDGYPSFAIPYGFQDPGDYPAVLQTTRPQVRNRLTVAIRFIMLIPLYVVLYIAGIAAGVVLLIAWFAVLFTGRWPEGMRNFAIGYTRFAHRTMAYALLVLDDYPPFRFQP